MPPDRDDGERRERERKELGLIEPLPPDYKHKTPPRPSHTPAPKPERQPSTHRPGAPPESADE